ncbi:uncharacterized protein LOC128880957 [Hylaeus volcanicus]|uniref:uncharacterized protein LOC128880957 n=1 Tax=Hylaeus volcanicus TaxID=313075 RepID=UPI0023B808AC|nr:uncharacterized protein LOC128880957 [Hylaeus volcanicus]
MSKDNKLFVKPKVRFCQTDVDKLRNDGLKSSIDQTNTAQSNKPRIRSIVTLDKPVILIKPKKQCGNQESKNFKSISNVKKTESLGVSSKTFSPCTNQIIPCSIDNSVRAENPKPLSDVNNIQNIQVNSEKTHVSKGSNESPSNAATFSAPLVTPNEISDKVPKLQNCAKRNISKTDCVKDRQEKENDALVTKKGIKNTIKRTVDLKVACCKTKSGPVIFNKEKSNVRSKPSTTSVGPKKLNTKSTTINVMPCHKYGKVTSKSKTSTVQTTVVRDIIGPKIKPYIGPGIQRKKQNDFKIPKTNENAHIRPCTSGEKLARPEYNSIMCTINKLNQLEKQKIVTDMEHLPATYKNLINGKISSALDFPLDEAIYKNLVDLSIDEKQLPSRLTRSRDPEPRQRDAVPVLSHFFTPVSSEEYCTPVCIKPRTPESIDSYSAFRISDKIFEWKDILDHV